MLPKKVKISMIHQLSGKMTFFGEYLDINEHLRKKSVMTV